MNTLFCTIECMLQIDLFLEATNLSRNTFNIWAIVQYQVTLTSSHFVDKHSPGGHWSSIHWRSTYLNVINLLTGLPPSWKNHGIYGILKISGISGKIATSFRWLQMDLQGPELQQPLELKHVYSMLYIFFNRSISCRCPSLS